MNPLAIGLGLGIANGGVNYLADNMWDKQIKSLTKDQQEISRFSSDLNAAKRSALNTALSLGDNSTVPLLLSSIGNKAGPTKYKSDFASSLISGISDSLNSIDYSTLFKKPKQKSITVEITPEVTKPKPVSHDYSNWNSLLTQTEQKLNNQYPTFSARDYILDSHQNKII